MKNAKQASIQEISIFILPLKEIFELINQGATRLVNFEMKFQSKRVYMAI